MAHVKPSLLSLSTYFSMVNCSYLFTSSPLTWTVLVEWKGRKRWKILDNAAPKGTAEVSPYVHLKEAISTDPQIVTKKKKKKNLTFSKVRTSATNFKRNTELEHLASDWW